MAIAIDTEERIDRPVDEVWAVLTDWDRAHEWMGVDLIRAEEPSKLGTRLVFTARGKDRESEITEFDAPRELRLTSHQDPVSATYAYSCADEGGATRVRLVAECEVRGPLRIFAPFLRMAIRRADEKQLRELKRVVEARA